MIDAIEPGAVVAEKPIVDVIGSNAIAELHEHPWQKVQMAFVPGIKWFQHETCLFGSGPVEFKVDIDWWKLGYQPEPHHSLFNFVKREIDVDIKVFLRAPLVAKSCVTAITAVVTLDASLH